MVEWQSGYIQSGTVRIHYQRAGSGVPLVMAHGMTDNGACWRALADPLTTMYDVVLMDARGHGLSDMDMAQMSTYHQACDVHALLTQLHLERPFLIGHSMGALTALACAAYFPAMLRAVILEDPPLETHETQPTAAQATAWTQEINTWLDSLHDLRLETLELRCIVDHPTWQAAELWAWAQSKQQTSSRNRWVDVSSNVQWQDLVVQLGVPALVVVGDVEHDAIINAATAQRARMLSPFIEIAYVRGVGHSIRREAPQAYAKLVNEFMRRHRA
jgi:pimeloyl-ACP methyl ester carboxylesterase